MPTDQEIVALRRLLCILTVPRTRGTHATQGHTGKQQSGGRERGQTWMRAFTVVSGERAGESGQWS